jgi:glycosyltransferase involved in cell wall biosynthesis
VRLHLFELGGRWLPDINFDAVDTLITVSPLLRHRTITQTGWAEDRVIVIPNTVDAFDLDRPKLPGARYRLAIVGIVPYRKRLDRALEVMQNLLDIDANFSLHVRGRMPWEYPYVWKNPIEREAYLGAFDRLSRSGRLAERVVFEPFGADMASWLRKVGFVISPSSSESFHLAPAEGMASGSIPVVWERDGVHDIFPDRFIVPDSDSAARLILEHVQWADRWEAETQLVKKEAMEFDLGSVGQRWLRLLHEVVDVPTSW